MASGEAVGGTQNTKHGMVTAAENKWIETIEMQQRIARMSPEEYGVRYAELMQKQDTPTLLRERAAMLDGINAARAAAAYTRFKKQRGLRDSDNSNEIRHLLTAAGARDGRQALEAIRQAAPAFHELDSLIHGWASKSPGDAVNWFNALSAESPEERDALSGLMWGLAENNPATARMVFHSLSPDDQLASAEGTARALYSTQGTQGIDDLVAGLPPEVAAKCIMGSLTRVRPRPPSELVPWLAGHVEAVPAVSAQLQSAWQRWLASDAEGASAWQQSNPGLASRLSREQDAP